MRCFLLVSVWICLSFFARAQGQTAATCLQAIQPVFPTVKYRASIDVLNKHLSGILIIKSEEHSARIVFINEMGSTFFDLALNENNYIFHSMMESLNKKAVRKTLAKDLGMIVGKGIFKGESQLLLQNPSHWIVLRQLKSKGNVRYHTNETCRGATLIENYGRHKKVISIQQFMLPNHDIPDSIFVEHHLVKFTIQLKQMSDAAE